MSVQYKGTTPLYSLLLGGTSSRPRQSRIFSAVHTKYRLRKLIHTSSTIANWHAVFFRARPGALGPSAHPGLLEADQGGKGLKACCGSGIEPRHFTTTHERERPQMVRRFVDRTSLILISRSTPAVAAAASAPVPSLARLEPAGEPEDSM